MKQKDEENKHNKANRYSLFPYTTSAHSNFSLPLSLFLFLSFVVMQRGSRETKGHSYIYLASGAGRAGDGDQRGGGAGDGGGDMQDGEPVQAQVGPGTRFPRGCISFSFRFSFIYLLFLMWETYTKKIDILTRVAEVIETANLTAVIHPKAAAPIDADQVCFLLSYYFHSSSS